MHRSQVSDIVMKDIRSLAALEKLRDVFIYINISNRLEYGSEFISENRHWKTGTV